MTKDYGIPEHTEDALIRYVKYRSPVGSFLLAVLANDLSGAILRADPQNRACLVGIVKYLYNEVPANAWGSREQVNKYLNKEE